VISHTQTLLRDAARPALDLVLGQLTEDTLRLACTRTGLQTPRGVQEARAALLAAAGARSGGNWLYCEVPRRRPRLAWQGMAARPTVTGVPTQVRAERRAPVDRLIWTNDNLVALKTLREERDPQTRDWRYRGKVDLIYIDPPFMANSDFVADNSISIDVDNDAGVSPVKEPSGTKIS